MIRSNKLFLVLKIQRSCQWRCCWKAPLECHVQAVQYATASGQLTSRVAIPANSLKLGDVFASVYGPCIWFVKLSLFVLYVNVFGPLRWLRILAYAGAIITGLFYFSVMIIYSVLCTPMSGHSSLAYLLALRSHRCAVTRPLITTLGVVSLLSDLYLILLPLPAVWQLHLPIRRKLAVSSMFFTGLMWVTVRDRLMYLLVLTHR